MRMALSTILDTMSVDFKPWTVRQALDSIDITEDYHQRLKKRMAETRRCKVPVYLTTSQSTGRPYIGNGHHRIKIAYELGFRWISVTDEWSKSAGEDADGNGDWEEERVR